MIKMRCIDLCMQHANVTTMSECYSDMDGYSPPLCRKLVDTLQRRQEKFHVQTLHVLGHNTKRDSQGNAYPIFHGFLVSMCLQQSKLLFFFLSDDLMFTQTEFESYSDSLMKFLVTHVSAKSY